MKYVYKLDFQFSTLQDILLLKKTGVTTNRQQKKYVDVSKKSWIFSLEPPNINPVSSTTTKNDRHR